MSAQFHPYGLLPWLTGLPLATLPTDKGKGKARAAPSPQPQPRPATPPPAAPNVPLPATVLTSEAARLAAVRAALESREARRLVVIAGLRVPARLYASFVSYLMSAGGRVRPSDYAGQSVTWQVF